ncbi:MAG: alpha/beta fold hydrolase [Myxococcales bacterium]|nr:alpha/beta fold hydrolase [Myxococcales bacterium]
MNLCKRYTVFFASMAQMLALTAAGCGDDGAGGGTASDGADEVAETGADAGGGTQADASSGSDGDATGSGLSGVVATAAVGELTGNPAAGVADEAIDCEQVVSDSDCDDSLRPIVFIHGTFGSATEISKPAMLFGSNGYCQDRFVAVEYNSLGGTPAADLAALVDQVLERTGAEQVDLMGHSQGTGHACTYLSNPDNAAKVAHYINISGACAGNGVPTLSLSSSNDIGATTHHSSGDNVEQVTLGEEDHVALAGSRDAFVAMWQYLMGSEPEYTTIQCGEELITLSGKIVTFGDNVPVADAVADFFEVDTLEDPRQRPEPAFSLAVAAGGAFNIQVRRGVRYEVRVRKADGTLLGYGYPGPFERSNYLARFLIESSNPIVAAASTAQAVRGPDHMVLVGRYIGGAFRADWGNSLKIDGKEVLTSDNAGRNASVVGLFMYDANQNGESELGSSFAAGFVQGTDVFIDASEPRWVEVEWTNEEGQTTELKIGNWPSSENLSSLTLP